jgi:hypothetical protein
MICIIKFTAVVIKSNHFATRNGCNNHLLLPDGGLKHSRLAHDVYNASITAATAK